GCTCRCWTCTIWTTWNSSPGRWNRRPPEPAAPLARDRGPGLGPGTHTPGHPSAHSGGDSTPGFRNRRSIRCAAPSSWRGGVLGEEVQHTVQSFLCRGCGQVELVLVVQGRGGIGGIEHRLVLPSG